MKQVKEISALRGLSGVTMRCRPLAVLSLVLLATGICFTPAPAGEEPKTMSYSESDKQLLLGLARGAIEAHLNGDTPQVPTNLPPLLCEPRGVFVSLHRQGRLRGCIGYLEAVKPLGQAIQEMAAAAAFHDPRFRPLQSHELKDLEVEISILTPMRRIAKVEEIQVGTHGLYIERGFSRGLLLPQVAVQCGWDRNTFLEQTCCKAGLPPDAWKDQAAKIYTFTAVILGEPSHPGACAPQESK
jgi:AmmeMemoRadiSam system protein A